MIYKRFIKKQGNSKANPRQFVMKTIQQLKRYLITGLLSALLEYSILYVMTSLFGFWHIISNTVAVFLSFWFNFLMNRFWSFRSNRNIYKQLCMYSMLFVVNMGASNGVMYILSDIFGIYYIFSKIVATGIIVTWNFILYKKVIYR